VIVDHETYQQFVEGAARRKWTLKGSIVVEPGVDIEAALKKAKGERIRQWKARQTKLRKPLRGS
jgi:hypothetical protein